MKHSVSASDEVEFTFGRGSHSFDFIFDAEALRRFIALAAEALADMDARRVQEQAQDAAALP
jgi:hypothetical protein